MLTTHLTFSAFQPSLKEGKPDPDPKPKTKQITDWIGQMDCNALINTSFIHTHHRCRNLRATLLSQVQINLIVYLHTLIMMTSPPSLLVLLPLFLISFLSSLPQVLAGCCCCDTKYMSCSSHTSGCDMSKRKDSSCAAWSNPRDECPRGWPYSWDNAYRHDCGVFSGSYQRCSACNQGWYENSGTSTYNGAR